MTSYELDEIINTNSYDEYIIKCDLLGLNKIEVSLEMRCFDTWNNLKKFLIPRLLLHNKNR